MKRLVHYLAISFAAATLLVAGCQQAPAAAPPKTPAEPAKSQATQPSPAPTQAASAPTSAPAAQPTAAPVKNVNFPGGKSITLIVPFAAGGAADLSVRLLAPYLEKEFGVPSVVANKPGADSQVGMSELVAAPADGHTLAMMSLPTTPMTYLDPARKANYGRKDLQSVAGYGGVPMVMASTPNSPINSVKDLLDAAKAKPGAINIGTSSKGVAYFGAMLLEKAAGVRFNLISFDSDGILVTAMLGGHVDVGFGAGSGFAPQAKSGAMRVFATMDRERYRALPDVKTVEEQGYKVYSVTLQPIITRAGTPMDVVNLISGAIKKATEDDAFQKKIAEVGLFSRYQTPSELDAYWAQQDPQIKELTDMAAQRQK